MNLPKIIFCFAVFYLFKCHTLFSQKDSLAKNYRISIDAAFITNSAYSHFTKIEETSRFTTETISTNSNSVKYLPGVSVGATLLLGNLNRSNFVFGLSCSLTNANYHYYLSTVDPEEGYSGSTDVTDKNVSSSFLYLNYELGYRFRFGRRFRLQPSLLINQNLITFQKENGYSRHVDYAYSISPSGQVPIYYNETYNTIHTSNTLRTSLQSSIRLSLFYEFKLRKHNYDVFAFRNFGIKSHLSWWAVGVSRFF